MECGLFEIYTGEGKGKSTASLGLMLRALGSGLRVYYVRMLKPRWKTGEMVMCSSLHDNLTFRNIEQEWILNKSKDIPEHVEAMRTALGKELDLIESAMIRDGYDVVICDEINYCIHYGLITVERAIALVEKRPSHVELVFTGRYAHEELVRRADLVTEVRNIKHPFQQGISARRGIEF